MQWAASMSLPRMSNTEDTGGVSGAFSNNEGACECCDCRGKGRREESQYGGQIKW